MRRALIVIAVFSVTPFSTAAFGDETFIDWDHLKNPVYSHEGWSTKDACMAYREDNDTFYIFFSAFFIDEVGECSHVTGVKTRDWKTFSEPLFIWDGHEDGWKGMASPDIVKIGDTYYLNYNTWGDKEGRPNQLFYATSKDLENWEPHRPLASNVTEGRRAIDAVIGYHEGRYFLQWKEFQRPRIACAGEMGPEGWERIGWVAGPWFENAELIMIDGKWKLIATQRFMRPGIRVMKGDGSDKDDWKRWSRFRTLDIPVEDFNTDYTANACFLADWRSYDGHFYLIYDGRTEGKSHIGMGNTRLGLARSKDLVAWEVPGK